MSRVRLLNPVTPGTRGCALIDRSSLSKGGPVKSLVVGCTSSGGRNNVGKMTVRNRGGGHKRCLRMVDYKRDKPGKAVVETLEHDPNRSGWICSIRYEDGTQSYIMAPDGIKLGDVVESGDKVEVALGSTMTLANVPLGVAVHNVEMKPGKGGQLARAAGASVSVVARDGDRVLLRLRSGEVRYVPASCRATVGVVSNTGHKNAVIGKAGRNRWLGWRPRVRAVAMNPVDHPMGGGEGKSSGGRHPVSRAGQYAKGQKTRKVRRYSDSAIKSRRVKR
jgi:large subunit ribosomal protein L2